MECFLFFLFAKEGEAPPPTQGERGKIERKWGKRLAEGLWLSNWRAKFIRDLLSLE